MFKRLPLPAIWLIQPDARPLKALANGLRANGRRVSTFPSVDPAAQVPL